MCALASPDLDELGHLYEEFGPRLEAFVRGDVRACDAVIEDACQLAWTQLIRHRHRVARDSAPRWLTKTAVREAFKMLSRHQRECSLERLLAEEAESRVDDEDEALSQRDRLLDIRSLPRRQQRIVWLRALGLSYDEVASHEACTFRTVDRQLGKARQRLRV